MAKTIIEFQSFSSTDLYDGRVSHDTLYASVEKNLHGVWMTVRKGSPNGEILFTTTLNEWAAAMGQFDEAVIEAAGRSLQDMFKSQHPNQGATVSGSP